MKISVTELTALADDPRIAFMTPGRRPIDGKMRLITAPKRKWKWPYYWLGVFLRREFPVHPAAHGSVPGKSPFTAGARHTGPTHILSRDVKDAFPNIKSDRFYLQMLAHGFVSETATLLTKLLLPDGYIPQGGPASNPAIDLYFYRVDAEIERELSIFGARYTRCTDNLDTSFADADRAGVIGDILETNLARLGLKVNPKKREEIGWQPVGQEQVLSGVRVDSPKGTQLPSKVLGILRQSCESLYRGARSAAPHTLVGLAKRRRSVQGWLNQASQADIAPVRQLQKRLHQVDFVIRTALSNEGIRSSRGWYTVREHVDTAEMLAKTWERRRRTMAIATATAPPVGARVIA